MSSQAQIALRYGITLSAEILPPHHIPKSKPNIEPAICQAGHAASHQRVSSFLPPHGHVGAGHFVDGRPCGINPAKLTAALKIGQHNSSDFLGRRVVTQKLGHRDGQLGQPHARDFNPKLSRRRQREYRDGAKECREAQAVQKPIWKTCFHGECEHE